MSSGFCGGNDVARKGEVYSRGFFNATYALDLFNTLTTPHRRPAPGAAAPLPPPPSSAPSLHPPPTPHTARNAQRTHGGTSGALPPPPHAPPPSGWISKPSRPGFGRQNGMSVTVDSRMYTWGGFAYSTSNPAGQTIFADGYMLAATTATTATTATAATTPPPQWTWTLLPELPVAVADAGLCAVGNTLYMQGGADFNGTDFCYNAKCDGTMVGLGRMFHTLDLNHIERGWEPLPPLPGTPRAWHQLSCVGGSVYAHGGSTTALVSGATVTVNVVDNWVYTVGGRRGGAASSAGVVGGAGARNGAGGNGVWSRLRDLPTSGSVFGGAGSDAAVFLDRYILLYTAFQYGQ